jgi:Lon protease (S16) C-terminal proteolytic domain
MTGGRSHLAELEFAETQPEQVDELPLKETVVYPDLGRGKLTVTGQLGEAMQESAQAALSWVRSHTEELELDERWFARHDVHVHVPAGAVPKDGPPAGIAMATAIASLVRETPVADDIAMTGEITLTGQVLPIGGVREKVLAAQRAGLARVILPRENEHDLDGAAGRDAGSRSLRPRRLDRGSLRRRVRLEWSASLQRSRATSDFAKIESTVSTHDGKDPV